MIKKLTLAIFFCLTILNSSAFSQNEVFIEVKIENEIITNVDIINEKKYLIALNNKLKNLNKKQLYSLSKNSLVREKIKKIELLKVFDFEKSNNLADGFLENIYKSLNFKNKNEFKVYLNSNNLKVSEIKEKILIEGLWNQLIFEKYSKNLNVDEEKLRIKLDKELKDKKFEEFSLYEITFELKNDESLNEKYNYILDFIKKNDFESAANIFSISESSKFGGKIGWTNKARISKKIVKEINKIKVGEITKPVQINNAYIILKMEDKRLVEKKINFEKEMNKLILLEKDKQLNQYSLMHFNRIKNNLFIDEN